MSSLRPRQRIEEEDWRSVLELDAKFIERE